MLNKDINSRFEDWLLNPREALDFEVKNWLDMSDAESQGIVAKALIALENHGGGFLLFGYREDGAKKLVPDPNRPASMEPYLTDAINAIVKRRSEPSFHVEVTLQQHPLTKEEYPLVRVTGRSRVPVRSDSATPGGSLKQHVYYIRTSGPESRAPTTAAEWDTLLRRALLTQREEIISLLRSLLPDGSELISSTPGKEQADLHSFSEACIERWKGLNDALPVTHPARITRGYFSFAARVSGARKDVTVKQILSANESSRKYTGWSAFVSLHRDDAKPTARDGGIEAWLAHIDNPDPGRADFWRIERLGNFFLLRGYQEDSPEISDKHGTPGQLFEATLPVWRLGEFLLRVNDLAAFMFEDGFTVAVECQWTGLEGRHLFSYNGRRYIPAYSSAGASVQTKGTFAQQALRELLPDVVKMLTHPLYENFEFFTPPDSFYSGELGEMTKTRF